MTTSARLRRWALARQRRNPGGHGKTGTNLLVEAAARIETTLRLIEERALHWEHEAERHDDHALPQNALSLEDQVESRREASRCRSRACEFRSLLSELSGAENSQEKPV